MSNLNDNPSKANGVDGEPLKRLATFKSPRDLSLGGVKPNKKIFTPNLNVTRNKNKAPTLPSGRDNKKDDKSRGDRKNDRKKNVKFGAQVIKSAGVFSQGLGSAERQHSSRISYGRDTDSTSTLQRPTIRVKDVYKIDKELEEQRTKSIVGDDDGDDLYEDFKRGNSLCNPVRLPMDDGGWLLKKPKVKQEIEVKKEPCDEDTPIDIKPLVEVKNEVYEESDVVNLLRSDQPTVILLQLPKILPGRGDYDEDDSHRKSEEPSSSTTENGEEKTAETKCHLSQLEEGRIAKMRIHQSGRVTLALGETIFEVNVGTKTAFYQELVSVAADDASRSASVISLGPMLHKLTIVPDWDALFADMSV